MKVTVDIGKQTREKAKDTLEKMAMHQAKTEPVQSGRTPGKKTSRMGGLFMYEHLKKYSRNLINLVLHFENKIGIGIRKLSK